MTTTVASYDAKSREEGGSQWLGWVSIGFLGLNILLLVTVVFLWRYRQPAGTGVVKDIASPIVSSVEVAAKEEALSAAPSDLRRSLRRTQGTAQDTAQDTAGLRASPMTSGAGSDEHPSAVMPSTTTSDTGTRLASSPREDGAVAKDGVRDEPASLSQGENMATLPATSLHTGDADGDINIFDVVRYAGNPKGTDVNGDGTIDIRDVIALDASFGSGGP